MQSFSRFKSSNSRTYIEPRRSIGARDNHNTQTLLTFQETVMFDHPSCSTPNGGTVAITIPPGWFTYVSGLARNNFNQMIRLRVTNSHGITNTEYFVHSPSNPTQTNETMRLRRTHEDSYSVGARADTQQLELTSYYSMDPKIKDRLLEKTNAVVSSLAVLQAETPKHLGQYPDYITFFGFIQASPDQEDTDMTPLYNDAVCMINMIKGTGLDHNGFPIYYDGSENNDITDEAVCEGSIPRSLSGGTTRSGMMDAIVDQRSTSNDTLDIIIVQDCSSNQQPYIDTLINEIVDITATIASSAKLAPSALRLGLIGFRNGGDECGIKAFSFTTDVDVMRDNLSTLTTAGSGGGPEAMGEALDVALMSEEWRIDATKLVILITDTSCGPGKAASRPLDTASTSKEPLTIARRMAEFGITLHVIACKPNPRTYYGHVSNYYADLTKVTGGLVLPLISASKLPHYIVGSLLERLELEALIALDGKTIGRRALFKRESPDNLIEIYHAEYAAAGVTVTSVEIEAVPRPEEVVEEIENDGTHDTATGIVIAPPLLEVFTRLFLELINFVRVKLLGSPFLPESLSELPPPDITLSKKPISKEQTARVVELGITKNAEVLASAKFVARPASEDPVHNSCKIDVPAGWYGFVSGLSRAKYHQTIKLRYTANGITNKEYLQAEFGQKDNMMRLRRTREPFYVFNAFEESNIALDISFFWSKDNVNGSALDKPQYASQKLKVIRTQTHMHSVEFFPDFITYFIMAEDQPDDEQIAGIPDFNDCVGIINLIKKTHMVCHDEA